MKDIIFVGWVNHGRAPVDGETAKNQYIIAELKKYCKVTVLDFYKKHKHPWIYLQALWAFMIQPKATIVLSTSASNIYSMLKWFKRFRFRISNTLTIFPKLVNLRIRCVSFFFHESWLRKDAMRFQRQQSF